MFSPWLLLWDWSRLEEKYLSSIHTAIYDSGGATIKGLSTMGAPKIDQTPRLAPSADGLRLTIFVWNDQQVGIKNKEFQFKPRHKGFVLRPRTLMYIWDQKTSQSKVNRCGFRRKGNLNGHGLTYPTMFVTYQTIHWLIYLYSIGLIIDISIQESTWKIKLVFLTGLETLIYISEFFWKHA